MIFSYPPFWPRDERTKVIFCVIIAASVCGLWLFFYDPIIIYFLPVLLVPRAHTHVEMNKIQWENYSRLARTMKEYQFFRLSTAAGLAPCLEQYYRRRAIQCRFGRIASGAVHRNGVFLREFLRQLVDLFEYRGLSLNFFRAIQGKRKISIRRWFLNLHTNETDSISKISWEFSNSLKKEVLFIYFNQLHNSLKRK